MSVLVRLPWGTHEGLHVAGLQRACHQLTFDRMSSNAYCSVSSGALNWLHPSSGIGAELRPVPMTLEKRGGVCHDGPMTSKDACLTIGGDFPPEPRMDYEYRGIRSGPFMAGRPEIQRLHPRGFGQWRDSVPNLQNRNLVRRPLRQLEAKVVCSLICPRWRKVPGRTSMVLSMVSPLDLEPIPLLATLASGVKGQVCNVRLYPFRRGFLIGFQSIDALERLILRDVATIIGSLGRLRCGRGARGYPHRCTEEEEKEYSSQGDQQVLKRYS